MDCEHCKKKKKKSLLKGVGSVPVRGFAVLNKISHRSGVVPMEMSVQFHMDRQ